MLHEFIQGSLPTYLIHIPSLQFIYKGNMFDHLQQQSIIKTMQSDLNLNFSSLDTNWEDRVRDYFQSQTAFAILSHRWSKEVTFVEMIKLSKQLGDLPKDMLNDPTQVSTFFATLESKCNKLFKDYPHPGLTKLLRFCHMAWLNGCSYAWIDTCCIDKSSSAELEESIRSMFHWYYQSKICIVHLADSNAVYDLWRDSWFKRGWTLQELLAPRAMKFYNKKWMSFTGRIMNKGNSQQGYEESHLWTIISDITGISTDDLLHFKPGMEDIRKRLHWASQRQTTRVEDIAYCLLGIFDISLPISYGEGKTAFYRLQVEIIQCSNDKGLFLWNGKASPFNSMLAAGPECFSMDIQVNKPQPSSLLHSAFKLTNNGLKIPLVLHDVDITAVKFPHLNSDGQVQEVQMKLEEPVVCFKLAILGESSSSSTTTTSTLAVLLSGQKYGDDTLYKRVPEIDIITMESLSVLKTMKSSDSGRRDTVIPYKLIIE